MSFSLATPRRWGSLRLPATEHTTRPWRIHEVASDFRVEDVWAYRTPGAGPDDFPAMLNALRTGGGLKKNPAIVRFLFAARWKLGAWFGWDQPRAGLTERVQPMRDRLPHDLRQDAAGDAMPNTPFTLVYELSDECALELANQTVHAVCHLGWVPTDHGEYELRMAALVKPNGWPGRLYMAAIKPFRYLLVYPALTRKWEQAWRDRDRLPRPGGPRSAGPSTDRPSDSSTGPDQSTPRRERGARLVTWAGGLIVLYGTAHTVGALTVEGAARHATTWFSRTLWGEDLGSMSPAMSAYWLSVNSFGPPLILIGLIVLWLNRRGLTAPPFIAWTLIGWVVLGLVVIGPGVGQDVILLIAAALLLAGARPGR